MFQPLPTSRRADGQDEWEELDAKLRFQSTGGTDQPEPQTKHGVVATTAEAPTGAAGEKEWRRKQGNEFKKQPKKGPFFTVVLDKE